MTRDVTKPKTRHVGIFTYVLCCPRIEPRKEKLGPRSLRDLFAVLTTFPQGTVRGGAVQRRRTPDEVLSRTLFSSTSIHRLWLSCDPVSLPLPHAHSELWTHAPA